MAKFLFLSKEKKNIIIWKIKEGLTDSVSRLVEMANKAVSKAESNGNSALEGTGGPTLPGVGH